MTNHLQKLRERLCRELVQSEHDAIVHPTREARRLGKVVPAERLHAIAAHAELLRPRLEALIQPRQPLGLRLGRLVGGAFSGLRHLLVDRLLSGERSYRATLLGLRHGLDTARLLREVARYDQRDDLLRFCEELIAGRTPLLSEAERALAWFASHPDRALLSGGRLAARS